MSTLTVEGIVPLTGTVMPSGSKNSAIRLFAASILTNEQVTIENVPLIPVILEELELLRSLGAEVQISPGSNKILINSSVITSWEIPASVGSSLRSSVLYIGPLLHRFGKARFPKFKKSVKFRVSPINRILEGWKALGFEISEDEDYYDIKKPDSYTDIARSYTFKHPTHIGTDALILASAVLRGETVLHNVSEESEINDLIEMLNIMGVTIIREVPTTLTIHGTSIFKGAAIKVQSDKVEVASFATAALLTAGNLTIKNVEKSSVFAFTNFLHKIGAKYEFNGSELKVWSVGNPLESADLQVNPSPGFVFDWKPLAALILSKIPGESYITDNVYPDRNGFVGDLTNFGLQIQPMMPSELGWTVNLSKDSYDITERGEPRNILKISGPVEFLPTEVYLSDAVYGLVHVVAALAARGTSTIHGYEHLGRYFDNIVGKLQSLGAQVSLYSEE